MRCALAFVVLAGCAVPMSETINGVIPDSTWVLRQMNGEQVQGVITLTFAEDDQITGQAPCNRYATRQSAPLPWFQLGPIAATKRACPLLELEIQYFRALEAMTLAEASEDLLILSNDADQSLVFEPAR